MIVEEAEKLEIENRKLDEERIFFINLYTEKAEECQRLMRELSDSKCIDYADLAPQKKITAKCKSPVKVRNSPKSQTVQPPGSPRILDNSAKNEKALKDIQGAIS